MKILTVLLAALVISGASPVQSFEGEIVYQDTFKSKIPSLTDEKFTDLMGAKQDYFIRGAQYKSVSNGSLLQWQIYIPAENRMYTKMTNNAAALWTDAGVNPDSVISAVVNKSVATILGYSCDELVLNCKSGTQKYYFNSSLAIDPELYVNHKFGNWYAVVSKTHAIPLKQEIDNAQFTMVATAVEIKPAKLDDSVFELPAGTQTDKGPY